MILRRLQYLIFAILCAGVLQAQSTSSPNFLIIQVDDMGYDDLSCNGNTVSNTPNINSLAEESVRFSNFMVNSVCAPTRASLLTGRNFWRTGVSAMHGGKDFLNLDETTFANVFQDNGYETGMWGKWHSGKADGYWPWDRGFDEAYYAKLYNYYPSNGWYNEYPKKTTHNGKWSAEVLADYAIDFISRKKSEPFLAYVSFLTCHDNWKAPEAYISKYREAGRTERFATLLGMLDFMDVQVGRILQHLQDEGLDENTVVLFMSDNGPNVGDTGSEEWALRNNHGYLGNKARLWQNGLKSPLYVHWKNVYTPTDVERFVSVTDIFPTLLDIAGLKVPSNNKKLDGRSIKAYLEGNTTSLEIGKDVFAHWFPVWEQEQFYPVLAEDKSKFEYASQKLSVISEDYKYLLNPVNVTGAPSKYNEKVLIDLKSDPMETTNIAASHPDKVSEMDSYLNNWFNEIKNDPGSFTSPEFQIGWKGKVESEVRGYGPCKTIGVTNDSHKLIGFDEVGDKAEYTLNINIPGTYLVTLNTEKSSLSGFTLKTTCGATEKTKKLNNNKSQEIGSFDLNGGLVTFAIELTAIDASETPKFGELLSFDFERTDEVKGLSHPNPTIETVNLFQNLKIVGEQGIIFGQHFSHYEGQNWRDSDYSVDLQSDCFSAVGDHPAMHGLDFGRGNNFAAFNPYVEEVYRRGGVSTYSWHAKNPVTGGNSKDLSESPVSKILEKGNYWDIWKAELDKVANVFNSLDVEGVKIPVIFRPFHENTGSWFWWGTGNCTNAEYKELWQITIDYLRETKGVQNMLVAYSPSKISAHENLARSMYPGDDYVDIIGFDAYGTNEDLVNYILEGSRIVCQWAADTHKVPAITEVGIRNGIQNSTTDDWFMSEFLDVLKNDPIANKVAYVLTWRNSAPDSYWVPLQGQPTYNSFVDFYNQTTTFFLQDIKNLYGQVDTSLGEYQEGAENLLNIYPNPAEIKVYVSLKTMPIDSIQIYDVSGRLMKSVKTDGTVIEYNLDVSNLKRGVYVVVVYANNDRYKKKLLVN